jgi:hypothetical protein
MSPLDKQGNYVHSKKAREFGKYYFGKPLNPVEMTLIQYQKVTEEERFEAFWKLQEKAKKLKAIRSKWNQKPDEFITAETPEGRWSSTPNFLYDDWLKEFEEVLDEV